MASVVSICNLALSSLGKDNINALTDAGAEARACSQFYEHARDTLLQGYPWRFAGKTQAMAQISNDKPGKWAFAYARPNDCLKVRWVRPQYNEAMGRLSPQDEVGFPHEVEGAAIYTDLATAFLHYTSRLTDPSMFPPLFVEALSWHLAVRLAMPLTRDPKQRAEAWQVANAMTGQAQMFDANEQRATSDHKTDFVEDR